MAEFNQAIEFILANEGGLVDNRKDKGGITNFGITLPMLTSYRKRQCSEQEIINLTQDEAKRLYELLFWDRLHISSLKQPIATAILDTAILHGQIVAVKYAQHLLGPAIIEDGILGPESLNALDRANPFLFIHSYVGLLQDRFVDLCVNATNQVVFLRGWLRRSRRLYTLVEP